MTTILGDIKFSQEKESLVRYNKEALQALKERGAEDIAQDNIKEIAQLPEFLERVQAHADRIAPDDRSSFLQTGVNKFTNIDVNKDYTKHDSAENMENYEKRVRQAEARVQAPTNEYLSRIKGIRYEGQEEQEGTEI